MNSTPIQDRPSKNARTLEEHLNRENGPKRILALDGGGVRGILSLQYLARIEQILRERYRDPDYVLADYFDLIGGTSTGAIIAAGLALRFPVSKIEERYNTLATRIFRRPFFRTGLGAILPKFGDRGVRLALQEMYGDSTTLGSPSLKTGLMIMTKRMDTGSPWPITNHPDDPYYLPVAGKKRIGSSNMLLWQIVRASTAAPHYFKPEGLEVGRWLDPSNGRTNVDRGQFVDGGVSTANNPSLQLLAIALLDGFSFRWATGDDRLLCVSVGTGLRDRHFGHARGFAATAGAFAFRSLLSIMDDCNNQNELIMQWLSTSPTARVINGQVGSLDRQHLAGCPLLSYLRYNIVMESGWVKDHLNIEWEQGRLNDLTKMDKPSNMGALAEIGAIGARELVKPEHFPDRFDPVRM